MIEVYHLLFVARLNILLLLKYWLLIGANKKLFFVLELKIELPFSLLWEVWYAKETEFYLVLLLGLEFFINAAFERDI